MAEPAHPIATSTQFACEECCRCWLIGAERWRVYLTDERPSIPVVYCAECARGEFD
jgi:hypothetical protein